MSFGNFPRTRYAGTLVRFGNADLSRDIARAREAGFEDAGTEHLLSNGVPLRPMLSAQSAHIAHNAAARIGEVQTPCGQYCVRALEGFAL